MTYLDDHRAKRVASRANAERKRCEEDESGLRNERSEKRRVRVQDGARDDRGERAGEFHRWILPLGDSRAYYDGLLRSRVRKEGQRVC